MFGTHTFGLLKAHQIIQSANDIKDQKYLEKRCQDVFQLQSKLPRTDNDLHEIIKGCLDILNTAYFPRYDAYQRDRIIHLLVSLPSPAAEYKFRDLKELKKTLILLAEAMPPELRANFILQAFCKNTLIGSVFRTKRLITAPTIGNKNSKLWKLAHLLERLLPYHQNIKLYDETRSALLKSKEVDEEVRENQKTFPLLFGYLADKGLLKENALREVLRP